MDRVKFTCPLPIWREKMPWNGTNNKKKYRIKLSSTKHLLCVLAVVITFVFSSCNSENETPVDYNTLPESIAKDFSNRYGANTIKQVCSGNNFYRHPWHSMSFMWSLIYLLWYALGLYCQEQIIKALYELRNKNIYNKVKEY